MITLHFLTNFCESWFLWWLLPFLLGLLLGWAIWAKWAKRARELEDEVASLKVKISDLEEKLESCGRDKKHYQDALSISENRLKDLKLRITELDSEIEQLNSDDSDSSSEDDQSNALEDNLSKGGKTGSIGFADDQSQVSIDEDRKEYNGGSEGDEGKGQEEDRGDGSEEGGSKGQEGDKGDGYASDQYKAQGEDGGSAYNADQGKDQENDKGVDKEGDNQDLKMVASSLSGTLIPDPSSSSSLSGAGKYDKMKDDNLQIIEGVGPKMESILHENGVNSWTKLASMSEGELQAILDKYGDRYRIIDPSGWPQQAAYASKGDWDGLIASQKEDGSASKAEKVMVKLGILKAWKKDDLKAIEGIGPKIEQLMHNAGITTWRQMAGTTANQINSILENAGKRFQLADPTTWPEQAGLAAEERWDELDRLQDHLKGGKNPS